MFKRNPSFNQPRLTRRLIIITIALLFPLGLAHANPLDQPRADGLVGERYDGYAELRGSDVPSDVVALVRTINRQRRALYENVASQQQVDVTDVGKIYAAKIFEKSPNGYWFLGPDGNWKRKF